MADFNDTIPSAPSGFFNVKWQKDTAGHISAYYEKGEGSEAVTSFNGRNGAVVSVLGDYPPNKLAASPTAAKYLRGDGAWQAIAVAEVSNAVSDLGSYSNPSWITSLPYSKLTSVPTTFAPSPHTHAAADITSGVLAVARLGTGTPTSSNYLRGDGTWQTVSSGGPVTSVFTRTGNVVAASGDYTAAQVTNAVDATGSYSNPSWISSLAYSKLSGVPTTFTPSAHTHDAADTISGVFNVNRLGTGTPTSSVYLRGDGVWAPSTIGSVVTTFNTRSGTVVPALGDYPMDKLAAAPSALLYLRGDGAWRSIAVSEVSNAVSTLGSYSDPSWITGLNWSKILGKPSTFPPDVHTHDASAIVSGVLTTARLGTGTADNTKYLRGDGTWQTVTAGGGSQTPWTSNIDAAGFELQNVSYLYQTKDSEVAWNMRFDVPLDDWVYVVNGAAGAIQMDADGSFDLYSAVGTAGSLFSVSKSRAYFGPTGSSITSDIFGFAPDQAGQGFKQFVRTSSGLNQWEWRYNASTFALELYRYNDSGIIVSTAAFTISRGNNAMIFNGDITLPTSTCRLMFGNGSYQKLQWQAGSAYWTGIETGCLYQLVPAAGIHRWYCGTAADAGATDKMELTTSAFTVNVPTTVVGSISTNGSVTGSSFIATAGSRLKVDLDNNGLWGEGIESGASYTLLATGLAHRWYQGTADGAGVQWN